MLGSKEHCLRYPINGFLTRLHNNRLTFGERLKVRERLKLHELGTPEHIWIAEAMLQLCYRKGASMACALQMGGWEEIATVATPPNDIL